AGRRHASTDSRGRIEEGPLIVAARARGGRADQGGAFNQLAPHVLPRVDALDQVGDPGAEEIGKRLDRENVTAGLREPERARPAIVVGEPHRALAPRVLIEAAKLQEREQHLVPLAKDVGADLDHVTDLALDRIPPTIDGRRNTLDDDSLLEILERAAGMAAGSHASIIPAESIRAERSRGTGDTRRTSRACRSASNG